MGYEADILGMAQQVKERRKHVRRPVLLKCRIEGTSAAGAMQLTSLSESGCFVATSEPVAVGSQVMLFVTLSGDEIPIIGRVVRVQEGRGFGVGIDLKLLSQYSRQTLEQFLRQSLASVSL